MILAPTVARSGVASLANRFRYLLAVGGALLGLASVACGQSAIENNNYCTNASFDSLTTNGWAWWAGGQYQYIATPSSYDNESNSIFSFGWWDGANIYQNTGYPIQPNTDYVLTARVRDGGDTAIGGVVLQMQDASASPWALLAGSTNNWSNSANKPGPWSIYSLRINAATIAGSVGDQMAISVGIHTNGSTQYGWMHMDWVQFAPAVPVFNVEPQNQSSYTGGTISLNAMAIGAVTNHVGAGSVLQYQWYKSPSTAVGGMTTNGTLTLANLALGDAGSYYVKAIGPLGTGQSSNATVTVQSLGSNVPPVIVSGPQSQVAYPHQTVQFSVVAAGAQPLSYQWRSNSVPIAGATGTNLVLMNISVAQTATYSVVVSNSYGNVSSNATLSMVLVPNFQGWGTSLCWWAKVAGGYANRNDYADAAFSQLKLNIIRYNIGGGENPSIQNTLAYRAQIPGFESSLGAWNWSADANQRWMMKAAIARGANLVEAFVNSPPWWMTVSGSVTGSTNGTSNNLQVSQESNFVNYMTAVVSNISVLDNVQFNLVTPVNEPTANWWTYGNSQEGCHMDANQQARVINSLRSALNSQNLSSVGINASQDNTEQQTVNSLNAYGSATNNVALISTHTYTANNAAGILNLSAKLNKPAWISEYGDGDASGMTMARRIHDDIVGTGASAWVYWQFVDNGSGWGMFYNSLSGQSDSAYTINKKFYVMWQFSNFIRPGSQILSAGDTNSLVAYNKTNSTLTIVTANNTGSSLNASFDLSAFNSVGSQAQRYRTSSTENAATLSSVGVTNKQITITASANSVTTHVISGVVLNPVVARLYGPAIVGQQMTFWVDVTAGAAYVIEAAPDIAPSAVWAPLSTNVGAASPILYSDTTGISALSRYYRVRILP